MSFRVGEPNNDGGLQVRKYYVSYRMEGSYSNNERVESWPATRDKANVYRIDGLIPTVLYLFKFAAENEVGQSSWTQEERFSSPLPISSPSSSATSLTLMGQSNACNYLTFIITSILISLIYSRAINNK